MIYTKLSFSTKSRKAFFLLLFSLLFSTLSCHKSTDELPQTISSSERYPAVHEHTTVVLPTFMGNFERNYHGDKAPSNLELVNSVKLGTGQTGVGGKILTWSGAGWTGQPLIFLEDTVVYILQGTYSHRVLKIRADNLNIEWAYDFGDMLKGTGTVWYNAKADSGNKFVLIQGGRLGFKNRLSSKVVPSLRAINYKTGKNLWKLNSKRTKCYSRDVDASALIHNDTAYIGLENGIFTVFDPNPSSADTLLGLLQPKVFEEHMLYEEQDRLLHRGNLVTESSPSILGNRIYVSSGSGHLYGYNLKTRTIDFDFKTGSDMDGSPVVTDDSCLIVSLEKEYIPGKAGVFKIDPSKPADSCVVWYYALPNRHFAHWQGGVIGSATINDSYRRKRDEIPNLAAFSTIDGHLYVVKTKELSGDSVLGPQNLRKYPSPQLVYKYKISESISTPVFVQNKIVAASYDGVRLFEFDSDLNFKLLDHFPAGSVEATPAVYNGKVYIASKNGLLYVLGDKSKPVNPTYDYITPDSRLFFSDARQIIRLGLK